MLKLTFQDTWVEAGCDETGRGCLAGPVVAAAVILPENFNNPVLNDSKQLSEANRNLLEGVIKQESVAWAIGSCDPREIDRYNILKASFMAMHRAIAKLSIRPELLLIDGNRFTAYPGIRHTCIVKGDATYMSIAAASVLAKTCRDRMMEQLHADLPMYGWNKNKGYPTVMHRKAIEKFGITEFHRKSFRLLQGDTTLFQTDCQSKLNKL